MNNTIFKKMISRRLAANALVAGLTLVSSPSQACTDVMLQGEVPYTNGVMQATWGPWPFVAPVVSARTLDFPEIFPAGYSILPVERNLGWQSYAVQDGQTNKTGVSWINTYGLIGVRATYVGRNSNFFDGMNEKGLSVGLLWLNETQYPDAPTNTTQALSILDFAAWAMGQFTNVVDVRNAMTNVVVWGEPLVMEGMPPMPLTFHAVIHDAQGHTLVVEWLNKTAHYYMDPADPAHPGTNDYVGVLANSPAYPAQIANLARYSALAPGKTAAGAEGLFGIRGDMSSMSRFVTAAKLRHCATHRLVESGDADFPSWFTWPAGSNPLFTDRKAVNAAWRVIGRVERPRNESLDGDIMETTIFSLVRVHDAYAPDFSNGNPTLYFRGVDNQLPRAIKLSNYDFTNYAGYGTSIDDIYPGHRWQIDHDNFGTASGKILTEQDVTGIDYYHDLW